MATTSTLVPTSTLQQFGLVFRRTMRDGVRNAPLAFVAPTLLASFVTLLFTAVFDAVADSPGFPVASFVEWVGPASVLLTAFVGAGYAASSLLRDIETGYLDRMRLLPIHPMVLVVARAAFEGVRIILPACVVMCGGLLLGVDNRNGVVGFVSIIAITALVAVAWNGVFFLVAMTTRSQQAVLGLQPLFMPIIMFSTFFAPTEAAPQWFDAIATVNPFTQLLNGVRGVLQANADGAGLAIGLAAFSALGLISYGLACRAYSGAIRPD